MTTSNLSTILTTLFTYAKDDEIKLIAPALGAFFTNISTNTSKLNLANQLLVLETQLLATLPQLEADVLKELNMLVQQEIASFTTSTSTAAS